MAMAAEGMEGGIGSDWDVGTIVWVRRRNGSWWPGRILGQHELSASHLMSPRSGTPVKLLGREDASVDWYNLEKSKRVKAFRCGEFDACIEKAEAAQGMPIKKREKYARREDAIIHALELERQMFKGKPSQLGGSSSTKHLGTLTKELPVDFPSESQIIDNDTYAPGKLMKCRKGDLPVATKARPLTTVSGTGCMLFANPSCTSDVAPRMRGLQDFGLQAVSKRKFSGSGPFDDCKKSFLVDRIEDPDLDPSRYVEGSYDYINKRSSSPSKIKRPLSGHNDEFRKRDKRRPILQVLQNSAKLKVPSYMAHNGYADDTKPWSSQLGYDGYLEEETEYPEPMIDPYGLELEEKIHLYPDMDLSSPSQSFVHGLADSGRSDGCGHDMAHPLEQDGSPDTKIRLLSSRTEDEKGDAGVSRWNLKGKRNIRRVSRRMNNQEFERNYQDKKGRSIQQDLYNQTGDSDENDLIENDLPFELRLNDARPQSVLQGSSIDDSDNSMDDSDKDSEGMMLPSNWDNEKFHPAHHKRLWEDAAELYSHAYTGHFHDIVVGSRLVDVNLKVHASYQGERVPLVSLMSRLNGKAIVGHPLQVEILSDGFTTSLLSDNDSGGNYSQSYGTTSQPVWRTGRRSSLLRIPRPHGTSAMEGESRIYTESDSRISFKRSFPLHLDSHGRLPKKISQSHRPAKKSHKKSSKKVSLSNLKTRTLSSLGKSHKYAPSQNKGDKPLNGSLGILMKPGEAAPMVACIPVKVVFSRILEAVGRAPSNAMVHRQLLIVAGSDDRKPS